MNAAPHVPTVSVLEARDLAARGAVLLDVREDDEWAAGHAPGATSLPMSRIAASVDGLPRDARLVAVCRSGSRSARVTQALVATGLDCVNMAGGMQDWAAAGLPVVTDEGTPGTVA